MNTTASGSKIYIPCKGGRISTRQKDWREIERRYTPTKRKCDWGKVVPKLHWKPGKSACRIASAWEKFNPNLPPEISGLFDAPVELLIATPEHSTPLKGVGGASRTDVFALVCKNGEKCAMVVEGKVDEPFGNQCAKEWLKGGESPENRIKRLRHILCHLGLSYQEAKDMPYQLLHRTACAVIEAKRFNAPCAAMVVHSFSCQQNGFGDFKNLLCKMMVKSPEAGKLHEVTERNIPFGVSLSLGWVNAR